MTNREYGQKALDLEMTDHVCRMEYSVLDHEELLKRVTGMAEVTLETRRKFMQMWDICMNWNILINRAFLGKYVTSMGHGVYKADGSDLNFNIHECFPSVEAALAFDPLAQLPDWQEDDLIKRFNDNCDAQNAWSPDTVNMTGTYISAMSGLIDMLGWKMLLDCAAEDMDLFGQLMNRYTAWMDRFFYALAKCKSPVVMVHDDIVWTEGPFIQPAWYRKYVFPAFERYVSILKAAGKKVLFTSDGTYTVFIDDIAACGVDMFVLEPTTDMAAIAKKYGKKCGFVGNADTRVLLFGDKEDIRREVQRCMNIGRDCPGFIMAVGNHIPANTPVDSCLWYDEFCKQYGRR